MVLLAISLSMLKRFPEAVEIHRRLIELQPNEAAHHNNLGILVAGYGRTR